MVGDCREQLRLLADESVHCVVTSPPYFGLRDYGHAGQIGLEPTPDEFVAALVGVFQEVRRVLRDDGILWLNLGDSYAGSGRGIGDTKTSNKGNPTSKDFHDRMVEEGAIGRAWVKPPPGLKQKDLIGIPWRVAFALQADGWFLRQDIIWAKPNPMPESVRDRCTKSHEYLFLLTKSDRYFYDADAIAEEAERGAAGSTFNRGKTAIHQGGRSSEEPRDDGPTRNKRSVWTVSTKPFSGAHFATFPPDLIEPCILAGCPRGGAVLDPFGGAGTTGLVAERHGRDSILIELNPDYAQMARDRIRNEAPLLADVA